MTPNLPEAAALIGEAEARDRTGMEQQAHALRRLGPPAVLVKGGHLDQPDSPDILASPAGSIWFEGDRIATRNTHGTGCSLSSAIAAQLAKGKAIEASVSKAKAWLAGAIGAADRLSVGSGHGPVHHFHHMWKQEEGSRQ